jgi:general secretion pathway protein K
VDESLKHAGLQGGGRRHAQGVALISALLIAALIASLATVLVKRQQLAIATATHLRDSLNARQLVNATEMAAIKLLAADAGQAAYDSTDEAWAKARLRADGTGLQAEAQLLDLQGRFNLASLNFDPAAMAADGGDGQLPGASGHAATALRAVAAAAGVELGPPVKAAPGGDLPPLLPQQVAIARFVLLLKALEIDPVIVPAVLDWLDADSETRFPNGAEDAYYANLDPAYRTANRAFVDESELLLVRGVTPALYARLRPFVVVLESSAALNLNTASPTVLMSLAPGIDRATAEQIVKARATQPFQTPSALANSPALAGRPISELGLSTASANFELSTRLSGEGPPSYFRSRIRRNDATRLRVVGREQDYRAPTAD